MALKSPPKVAQVPCSHCKRTGSIPLTGVYAEALEIVRKHPDSNGADLASLAGIKASAMNNRLVALERHGLIVRTPYGRESRWRIAT